MGTTTITRAEREQVDALKAQEHSKYIVGIWESAPMKICVLRTLEELGEQLEVAEPPHAQAP